MFSQRGSHSDNASNHWRARGANLGQFLRLGIVMIAVLSLGGCGPSESRVPVFPVTGKVTFDGKTPIGAQVILVPTGKSEAVGVAPSGGVKDDGTFTITSYDLDDGAPEGEYVATVQWYKFDEKLGGIGPNVIPKKYGAAATSPIKVSVKGGPTEIPPITITKK